MRWWTRVIVFAAAAALSDRAAAGDFDGARAFADLKELVRLGPRLPESPASEQARALIVDRLRQAGWKAEPRPLSAVRPNGGPLALVNIVARKARPGAKRIFLVTHFDTKSLAVGGTVGANDGGSGVAALLEIARQLPSGLEHAELWLIFCDGSEPLVGEVSETDGLFGSRALVRDLEREGEMKSLTAVIFVDLVADRELRLTPGQPRGADLAGTLANVAHEQGEDDALDLSKEYFVPGDQRAFLERGVTSVLAFTDFEFGGPSSPGPLFHTVEDNLGSVSASSLQVSGKLLLALVRALDR